MPNYAALTPIKYSLKLVEILYNETIYTKVTNTKYEGLIKDAGDRVRIRTLGKLTLSAYTKEMTLVGQNLTPTFEDLIIDQQYYFKFIVDDIDKLQNDIDTINEYAQISRRDITELIDTDIMQYMRKNVLGDNVIGTDYAIGTVGVAITTGIVTGTGTTFTAAMVGGYFKAAGHTKYYLVTTFTSATQITVQDLGTTGYTGGTITAGATYIIKGATALALTKTTIYDQIVNLGTVLGTAKTPSEGRFIIINSAMQGMLRKSPEFIPAIQQSYNDVVLGARVGSIGGLDVYVTELVDGNNTTGFWFVAGTRDFCSMAVQILKVSMVASENDPNSFSATCKGLAVWGRKVLDGNRGRGAALRATIS